MIHGLYRSKVWCQRVETTNQRGNAEISRRRRSEEGEGECFAPFYLKIIEFCMKMLLFWSRKWPSEASNHHFFPLRGLVEGCALPGAEEIFIDLGGGAPKTPTFYAKLTEIRLFIVFATCDGHDGWLAEPRPLARNRVSVWTPSCGSIDESR